MKTQNDLFLTIFFKIRPICEWQEINNFNINYSNHISTKETKKYKILDFFEQKMQKPQI